MLPDLGSPCIAAYRRNFSGGLGGEGIPVVGLGQIRAAGQGGQDPPWIEGEEVAEVVLLDLLGVAGGGDAGELVEIPQVRAEGGVVLDALAAALEEAVVHQVKAK